jgi:hypothetical protein
MPKGDRRAHSPREEGAHLISRNRVLLFDVKGYNSPTLEGIQEGTIP